ncbi:hypothetical protein BH11ARM2_BH11ARM2_07900 [soil metagenome]
MLPIPTETTQITRAQWLTGPKVAQYAQAELRVGLSGPVANPFDPEEAALDAKVTAPSGRVLVVPGFLYRAYVHKTGPIVRPIAISSTQALADGKVSSTERDENGEILEPTAPAEWRVRFAPSEKGVYRVALVWRTRQGTAKRNVGTLTATPAKGGFVRVSKRDPRYFALDDGSSYWPLGANLGWAGPRGTRDYDDWIPTFAKSGANWGRVWLAPHWTTFALERPGMPPIDLANAWRLDYVLGLAQKNGMRLALCIESYNILRDKINWPEWERSPINKANGGPLAKPGDFWTDPEAARLFRNKLRYLVARYGANSSVMSWEFWNEVDGVTDYKTAPVRDWHDRMARALKAMDPYRHLVTTSFGGQGATAGDAEIFKLPSLDYTQSHSYEAPDIPQALDEANRRLGALLKPHFIGEVGADTTGPRAEDDPTGLQIHDPLWAAVAVGEGGGAMPWWWDSYIFPKRLDALFRPVAAFVANVEFDRESFRRAPISFAYQTPPKETAKRDIVFASAFPGWNPSFQNGPRTIRIDRNGPDDLRPLAAIQQGVGNHADLHNPVTFEINLPWPTRLVTEVGDVSGYGGAKLVARLDGQEAIHKDFTDPDGDRMTDTLKGFAGDYAVEVPAGRHRVEIENTGQDWFNVVFRIVGAREQKTPPLLGWAVVGKTTALAWVRQEERTWKAVAVQKRVIPPVPPSVLSFPGLPPGSWTAELWDTETGKIIGHAKVEKGRVPLPKIATDLAVKLRRRYSPFSSPLVR